MTNKPKIGETPPAQRDLDNMMVVVDILVEGTDEELERLRLHIENRTKQPFPKERLLMYRQFAQQRSRQIAESDADCKLREATNPKATALEYEVGAYKERMEGPVREAVFDLRSKGYASFESGFSGMDRQRISFEPSIPELASHVFSEATHAEAERLGVELGVSQEHVGFRMSRPLSDEEMTGMWNLIVRELPPVSPPQPLTTVKTAQTFRAKQDASR